MFRRWLLCLLMLAPLAQADEQPFPQTPQHSAMDEFVAGLTQTLLGNARYVNLKTPMVVATLVDVDQLNKGSALGLALAEGFTSYLHQGGYTLVDLKSQGVIEINDQGEFFLTRNADRLRQMTPVDFVLAGTLSRSQEGVDVNVRIIGIKSKIVVAAASGFLPESALGQDERRQRQVLARDGYLERDSATDRQ